MAKLIEIEVEPQPIAILEGRSLWRTTAEGKVKDGKDRQGADLELIYPRGAYVLADRDMNVICGPISRGAAHLMALEIVSGNRRMLTRPGVTLQLAVALLSMTLEPKPDAAASSIAIAQEAS